MMMDWGLFQFIEKEAVGAAYCSSQFFFFWLNSLLLKSVYEFSD